MITREISKTPEIPKLNEELYHSLTEFCFGKYEKFDFVDLIFVFGTPFFIEQASLAVTSLLENKAANKVLITGGIMPHGIPFETQKSEAQLIYEKIPNRYSDVSFYLEPESKNTLTNVTEGLKLLNFRHYNKLCFIFPSHGATRGYLTLRKFLPKVHIYKSTYDAQYPGEHQQITKDNWHNSECGRKRVWGEYLRIKQYGQRGDIEYGEVKKLIDDIDRIIVDSN